MTLLWIHYIVSKVNNWFNVALFAVMSFLPPYIPHFWKLLLASKLASNIYRDCLQKLFHFSPQWFFNWFWWTMLLYNFFILKVLLFTHHSEDEVVNQPILSLSLSCIRWVSEIRRQQGRQSALLWTHFSLCFAVAWLLVHSDFAFLLNILLSCFGKNIMFQQNIKNMFLTVSDNWRIL